ncbi:MAG: hypothetical protein HRU20_06545 [Pseudomonadales bacterium]|nr:hypothetical protein [Pseudomonadales bacterium]
MNLQQSFAQIKIMILVSSMVLFSASPLYAHTKGKGLSPAQEIAEVVKQSLDGIQASQVQAMMAQHYMRLRLLSPTGEWADESLANNAAYLLPDDIGEEEVDAFIDEMAKNAHKNKYLKKFLKKASHHSFDELKMKVATEGPTVFPLAVTYALMLDRLTVAMQNDWRVLAASISIYNATADSIDMWTKIAPVEAAKIKMVEGPMKDYVAVHSGEVALIDDFLKVGLQDNISWAQSIDGYLGYTDNAYVAGVLNQYPANADGMSPAYISEDGTAINLQMAESRRWDDLYQTWNMAFVSQYANFPFVLPKLLIPSVSNYKHDADGYIYTRSLALYTQLYYSFITRVDTNNAPSIDWNDTELSQLWGKVNKASALKYMKKADK